MQPAGAPARLELGEGTVDVWVADLDAVGARYDELLSDEERARAGRFLRERNGRRWAHARGVLRALLGEYLRSDPRALRFATGAHGKPELARARVKPPLPTDAREPEPPDPAGEPHFNLAHSGGVALYAVARGRPVGVDVEVAGRRIDVLAVATRALGPATAKRLGALHVEAREREFLREWVRHEAALKCLGTGLAGGSETDADGRRPWVAELDLRRWTATAAAAVATMGEPAEVRFWEWPALGAATWLGMGKARRDQAR